MTRNEALELLGYIALYSSSIPPHMRNHNQTTIENIEAMQKEYKLIKEKKSKLSAMERKKIVDFFERESND